MTTTANPEYQIWPKSRINPDGGCAEGYVRRYFPIQPDRIILQDIGRKWLEEKGLKRNDQHRFTHWENV